MESLAHASATVRLGEIGRALHASFTGLDPLEDPPTGLDALLAQVGNGVACFTLDRETGSWWLTEDRMSIPVQTKEYAINASNARHWHPPVKRYVDELLAGQTGPRGRDYNMRLVTPGADT